MGCPKMLDWIKNIDCLHHNQMILYRISFSILATLLSATVEKLSINALVRLYHHKVE